MEQTSGNRQRLIGLCLLCLASSAAAVDDGEIARCATIEAPSQRLICYDKLAADLIVDTPDNKWQIQTEGSSSDVYLYLTAEEPFSDSAGQPVWPTIWLRCKDDTTAALIAWDVYLGEYEQNVTYRIDSRPARREWWEIALSKEVAGLWTGEAAIPFIKQLFGAQQLLVWVSPNRGSTITATFRIAGLEQAIAPLRRACLW